MFDSKADALPPRPRTHAATVIKDAPTRRTLRAVAAVFIILFAGLVAVVRPPGALAITGGSPVNAGTFPFTAQVNVNGGRFCTGSLIDPRFVLTADHCVHSAPVGGYSVYVGNNIDRTGGEYRTVKRIYANPWYGANPQGDGGHNDLALLELSTPITTIAPVRLATPDLRALWDGVAAGALFKAPDFGIAVGWGTYDQVNFPASNQLQWRQVTLGQSLDGINIPMITSGEALCKGDSGGPLLVSWGGQNLQVGVAKGASCGPGGGNWSIVGEGANRDWILSVLAPEDPLLAAVPKGTCGNYEQDYTLNVAVSDQQRLAVQCLINHVRVKAGLNKLSFCALSGTYCENNIPGAPSLNFAQMKGFNIAAQYRATDVKNGTSGSQYSPYGRPSEWWPRSDAYLCLGLTSAQCQTWYAPGWLPAVYEAQAYGVDGATPREAVDKILKSSARAAILKPGLNFSGVGASIGQSAGLFMPYSKTGNVYDVFTS